MPHISSGDSERTSQPTGALETFPNLDRRKLETERAYHLWMPDIFGFKGGIQTFSAFFLEAFARLHPRVPIEVFLKHDRQLPGEDSKYPANVRFHFAGRLPLRLRTAGFAAQLLAFGMRQAPNLVVATHLNFAPAAALIKRWRGTPYWVVVHGVEAWNLADAARIEALRRADKILAVSHYTRDRLLKEQEIERDRVVLLANTCDAERFTIRPKPDDLLARHALSPQQPVMLTVSRLSRSDGYKGYDRVLRALPQIRQQVPDVKYILVGKGDDLPRIEAWIRELDLEDCVILTGFVADAELPTYYNLCDLFLLPSQGEGFGIVYLEALASGKPAIGGDRDGAIDALQAGELGVLVPPDDVEAIARSAIAILQKSHPNPLLYRPEQLRQKMQANFGFERFQAMLASHFDREQL